MMGGSLTPQVSRGQIQLALAFLAVVIGVTQLGFAEEEPGPRVQVGETTIDLGDVAYATQLVHPIPIKNTGTETLSIEIASANCGCALGEFENGNIAPGQEIAVNITVTPKNAYAHVKLSTNDPKMPEIEVTVRARFVASVEVDSKTIEFADCDVRTEQRKALTVVCRAPASGIIPMVESLTIEPAGVVEARLVGEKSEGSEKRYQYEFVLLPHPASSGARYTARVRTDALDVPEISVPLVSTYRYPWTSDPETVVLRPDAGDATAISIVPTNDGAPGQPVSVVSLDARLKVKMGTLGDAAARQMEVALVEGEVKKGFRTKLLVLDSEGFTLCETPVVVMSGK